MSILKESKEIMSDVLLNTAIFYGFNTLGVSSEVARVFGNNPVLQAGAGAVLIEGAHIAASYLPSDIPIIAPKPLGTMAQEIERVIFDTAALWVLDMAGVDDTINNLIGSGPVQEAAKMALTTEASEITVSLMRKTGLLKPVDAFITEFI